MMRRIPWFLVAAWSLVAGCGLGVQLPPSAEDAPEAVVLAAAKTAFLRPSTGGSCSVTPSDPPLTARHCYDAALPEDGKAGDVLDPDGHWHTVVDVWQPDMRRDIVALELDPPLGEPVPFGPEPSLLDDLWTAGYGCPINHTDVLLHGALYLTDTQRSLVLAVEPPFCHGDSGGPVFDAEGRVVGVVSRMAEPGPGLAERIPKVLR